MPLVKIRTFRQSALALAFASILVGTVSSSVALAQDREDPLALLYGDEETVSIATGSKKPLRLAPSIASVITAEDIRAMGAQSLDDVLQAVPGVHVSLSRRYSSLISIRGIHTNLNPQVLLLINGQPVTELFTGGRVPTFRLPVRSIERVEVIRGPGSAVYGADAFAGVINVITKTPQDLPSLEVGLASGAFETFSGWVQTSGRWGDWELGLTIEALTSDGDQDRIIEQDLQSNLDLAFGTAASVAPSAAATNYDVLNTSISARREHWEISLNSWEQDEGGIGAGIAEALDPVGHQSAEQHLFSASYNTEDLYPDWQIDASLTYFYAEQKSYFSLFPAGAVLPIGEDGNVDFASPVAAVRFIDGMIGTPSGHDQSTTLELSGYFTGIPSHRVRLAGGYKAQRERVLESKNYGPGVLEQGETEIDGTLTDVSGTPFIYIPNQRRNIRYLSIQDEWALLPDWELTAGVRYDDYSDFGHTFNPRLALVWQTNYRLTSKLLYGRAFRAPSFSEQFAINNPVILGNPDVDPEQIDTVELSFEYRPNYDLKTRLNVFRYEVEGLVDYVDDDGLPGGSRIAQNVHDQRGTGFEVEADWNVSGSVSISANYSWQRSENISTGHSIPDAPQKLTHVDFRWKPTAKWTLASQLYNVADRERSQGDTRPPVEDYRITNLSLYRDQFRPYLDVHLSVRNLFDNDAREPSLGPNASILSDHPLEGRRWMVEFTLRPSR